MERRSKLQERAEKLEMLVELEHEEELRISEYHDDLSNNVSL